MSLARWKIPTSFPSRIGSLVETSATIMMMISGIAAKRVNSPTMMSVPQIKFDDADEGTHHIRKRNVNPGNASRAQNVRKHQFLNAFWHKDSKTHQEPNEDGPTRRIGLKNSRSSRYVSSPAFILFSAVSAE